jgi:ketosteroid isomerase-like protein
MFMGGNANSVFAAAVVLTLAPAGPALAQGAPLTAQALADRAAVSDLITSYYNNFGGGVESKIAEYYAEDGEMILGANHYKGIEAIKGAYAAVPADAPQRKSFALNILISNLLVTVHGNTATARLVFTETTTEKQGDAPKILTQGREFDNLVKRNGRWLISKRWITGPKGVPEGWQE